MIYHTVYKTTNILNGKFYYGVHSTNNINDDYLGSGKFLKKAIKKYGKQNFKKEIIAIFDERDKALFLEKDIVTKKLVEDNNCYNGIFGGNAPPKQNSNNLIKNKLKGKDRTQKQKKAAKNHSIKMKGRKAPNKKTTNIFGKSFDSVRDAINYFSLSTSQFYFLKKNPDKFNSAKELKEYLLKLKGEKISKSKKWKK